MIKTNVSDNFKKYSTPFNARRAGMNIASRLGGKVVSVIEDTKTGKFSPLLKLDTRKIGLAYPHLQEYAKKQSLVQALASYNLELEPKKLANGKWFI